MRYISTLCHVAYLECSIVLTGCATNIDCVRDAAQGHTATVQTSLTKGAEADTVDREGKTALMLASFEGHVSTVQLLLANGAQVNAKDKDNTTALMLAASRGHLDVLQALLAQGAEANTPSHTGQTALLLAVTGGHGHITQALLTKGADRELNNCAGQTAVTMAYARGASHLLEQTPQTPGQASGEVVSLLYDAEKRAREAEQRARQIEQQRLQQSDPCRTASNTPPPCITLQQPARAQNTRGLIVTEADSRIAGTVREGAGTPRLFINGKPVS